MLALGICWFDILIYYTPFKVIKYWLYYLCYAIQPCSLLILYIEAVPLNPLSLSCLSPTPLSPLVITGIVWNLYLWVFFCCYIYLFNFQIPYISDNTKLCYFYLSFCLTYFIKYNTLQVHLYSYKWQNFILFYGWSIFLCVCVYVTSS